MEKEKKELTVEIRADHITLGGDLIVPALARGIVVFAHGSGSSRFSLRNQYVAGVLQNDGFATLLFDLLTPEEEMLDEETGEYRFNIRLLADRMKSSTRWLLKNDDAKDLNVGYFGASTGAAAALIAAAEQKDRIEAIVLRGGRPDLAYDFLPLVKAPTLLIAGGNDSTVVELNKKALQKLTAKNELLIIPRATHLFEEPGALEAVAHAAADWFAQYLSGDGNNSRKKATVNSGN
jgi:pimeloyl-ACP methyl ester carboxylesterase